MSAILTQKAIAQGNLRAVLFHNWKWSLSIINPDTLVLTILAAPCDLVNNRIDGKEPTQGVLEIDTNNLPKQYCGKTLEALTVIVSEMKGQSEVKAEIRVGTVQTPFRVLSR